MAIAPRIQSETKFFWKILLHLLLTPYTLIMVLMKKKKSDDIFKPFHELFLFVFEPKFTILVILANIGIYIWSLFQPEELILSLINIPSNLFELRLETLITSGFLHASPAHLLGNMLALFIFGRVVERKLGFLKTGLVYLGALVISNIFFSIIHFLILGDNTGGLGASGAIMGLASAAMLLDPLYITYELLLPLPVMIVAWLMIFADISGILNPVEDGIGHFAHLGGFLSIGALTFLFDKRDRHNLKRGLLINIISVIIGVGLIIAFGLTEQLQTLL